jgi:hypothetical protein
MLLITIPLQSEQWDEEKEEFVSSPGVTLQLEHSLVSLAKWESKWCKAFLGKGVKTSEETLDYIKCMTLTPNVDPEIYDHLTRENIEAVNTYIGAPMSATYISDEKQAKGSKETVTAELIYYWMIALQIPFECQHWHLNRLLTLVKVCNVKNSPPKKMSKRDLASRNARLNAARRQQLNTRG